MSETYLAELNIAFKILNFTGMNPLSKRTGGFRFGCTATLYILFITHTIVSHFVPAQISFQDQCNITFGSAAIFFSSIRAMTLIVKKKGFVVFVDKLNQFWPIENQDEAVTKQCKAILKLTRLATRTFLYICLFDLCIFLVLAFFGKPLLFKLYEPDFVPWPLFVLWFNIYCYGGTLIAVAFDGIYVTFAMLLLIQTKLLNSKFQKHFDSGEDNNDQLRMYVNHHNFILRQTEELCNIYGPMLLASIWSSAAMMTTVLYGIALDDGTNLDRTTQIQGLLTLAALVTTFFFLYFIPSQLLSDEIAKLSDSLYLSEWLKGSSSKKRSFSIILMKSQKEVVIKAGNFVPMNFRIALAITKTAFSFFTFLRTMQDKFTE